MLAVLILIALVLLFGSRAVIRGATNGAGVLLMIFGLIIFAAYVTA